MTDSRVAPYRSLLDLPDEWAAHPGLYTGISAGIAATMGETRGFLAEGERGLLIYTAHDGAPHPGIPSVMDVQAGQVSLLGLGTPEAVARLVNRLVREGHLEDDAISAVVQYGLPRGTRDEIRYLALSGVGALPEVFLKETTGGWDWMVIDEPPALVEQEDAVEEITGDAAAIARVFNHAAPTGELHPEAPGSRWFVAGDDAVAAARQRFGSGPWTLGSIGTAVDARRRGLGAAVTAAATRAVLTNEPFVTLGHMEGNAAAKALYESVGYRTIQAFEGFRLDRANRE